MADEPFPECEHLSASGISTREGPEKVWRCDGCGWLHLSVSTGEPYTFRPVDVEDALRAMLLHSRLFPGDFIRRDGTRSTVYAEPQ